jgi:hypothetical protein
MSMMSVQNQPTSNEPPKEPRHNGGAFGPGNPYRFPPGRSGNPGGRPKGASFSAALARQAVAPVADRQEMANIARTIGLDPALARNIDVVAALFYVVLARSLLRSANSVGRPDEKIVGMLQVLLKALDPTELRVSGPGGGPIPVAAVVANVQAALGMLPAQMDRTPGADDANGSDAANQTVIEERSEAGRDLPDVPAQGAPPADDAGIDPLTLAATSADSA